MKNSKKGISLIVLVITIIVIIILAAAVILTLNKNNPIEEANDARYASDTANMQAILTNVVAKIMAEKQSVITFAGAQEVSASKNISFTFDNAMDGTTETCQIAFAVKPSTPADNTWYTGKALPTYSGKTVKWAVDIEGNIYLKIGEDSSDGTKKASVYPKNSTFPSI